MGARGSPVFFSERSQYYVVPRHADIKAVFEDWQTFSSENAQAPLRPMCAEGKEIMQARRLHRLFRTVGPRSARPHPDPQGGAGLLRPTPLQGDRARDPARSSTTPSTPSSLTARPISSASSPMTCRHSCCSSWSACRTADVAQVKAWAVSRALLTWGNLSDEEQLPHAHNMVAYWDYCRDLVASAMSRSSDDLPGDLIRLQKEGAEISDDEIAGVLYSVLFAGHETTTTLIANGVARIAGAPSQLGSAGRRPGADSRRRGRNPALQPVDRGVAAARAEGRRDRRRRRSPRARTYCCCSAPPIATRRRSPSHRASTSRARIRAAILRSATASISASASNSPRWSLRSRWKS